MKISQVLAVEKSAKVSANSKGSELLKQNGQTNLFNGMIRTFAPVSDGDILPEETQLVQNKAKDNLDLFQELLTELWDRTLTKDVGNQSASASVVVGNLSTNPLPVTYLIWLEKQLNDLKTFVRSLPVLDPSKDWAQNVNPTSGLYETSGSQTTRTKKVAKVVQLTAATEHHKAEAQLTHEDVLAGVWTTKHLSSAFPRQQVDRMLTRVELLLRAVKTAREEANSSSVSDQSVSQSLFDYILG